MASLILGRFWPLNRNLTCCNNRKSISGGGLAVSLLQDLSFAIRQLVRHRVYAITAIASMALGIGATAAVYSVLYGVLIDPYPYPDADRLAFVTIHTKQGRGEIPFTLAEADQLRKTKSVEDVLSQNDESMIATDGEIPQSVKV